MPLLTIDDLLKYNEEELAAPIHQAKALSSIYDAWLEEDEGDAHSRKPGIHASEVASCPRKMVYALRGETREGRNRKFWRQRFKAGHAIHGWLQDDFHKMAKQSGGALRFESEVKIGPEHQQLAAAFNIQSSTDGVFTFCEAVGEDNGQPLWVDVLRVGLEIKSEAPDGYEKLREPKPEHIEQAHVYMACLDLPLMWFLYTNKANQNNTPSDGNWLIRFDTQLWHSMEQRFKAAHQFAAEGRLPERSEGIYCEFCAFRKPCRPDYLMRRAQPFAPLRSSRP